MNKLLKLLMISFLGFFLCVGHSGAYQTDILGAPSGESDLDDILDSVYVDFGYSYSRVDDDYDQLWEFPGPNNGLFYVEAKYAGHTHDFGYYLETSPDVFNPIILGAGPGNSASLGSFDEAFYFGLHDINTDNYWSSNEADNGPNYFDHMVTYQIVDPDNSFHYAIAFEDLDLGDQDYNDLVIDVLYVQPADSVPEPATMLLLGTGLIGIFGLGRKKLFK